MISRLPAVIDRPGTGPVVAAVRNAHVHKPVTIRPGLDPAALMFDLRRAMLRFHILRDMQKGPWNRRVWRGRKLLRAIVPEEVEVLLRQDAAGKWWKKTLIETATQDEFMAWRGSFLPWGLETAKEIAAFQDGVRRLLAERFTARGDPRSARMVLGDGSALEWAIRRRPSDLPENESFCFATIFERHFGLTARINGSGKKVGGVWHDYTRSPFLAFVTAVLRANGIAATPDTIRKTFHG